MAKKDETLTVERLADKYKELFTRLMDVADYLAAQHDDCPYFIAIADNYTNDGERYAKALAVSRGLCCPVGCTGFVDGKDVHGCWRKWVIESKGEWWKI